MDQNINQPENNSFKKILNAKTIFVVLGIVVVAELVWAGMTLFKSSTQVVPQQQRASVSSAAISLTTNVTSVKVGDKFTVSINMSSNRKTDGTDLVILYDAKVLSVDTISGKNPLILGSIYKDYPLNALDAQNSRVTVSGITDQKDGVSANGLFGSLVFTAKSAGQTKISLDFTLGKTTDSNVIESATGKDILGSVGNLELTISK